MKYLRITVLLVICLTLVIPIFKSEELVSKNHKKEKKAMKTIQVTSPAFTDGGSIPAQYTCDGKNISPEIRWDGVPHDAHTIVLICDDPDAPMGTWVHWVVFNIPPHVKLAEGVQVAGAIEGTNSWGKTGYGGPCPPSGTHRYYFKVYALDKLLDLTSAATKEDVMAAIQKTAKILAQGQLMGTYERTK